MTPVVNPALSGTWEFYSISLSPTPISHAKLLSTLPAAIGARDLALFEKKSQVSQVPTRHPNVMLVLCPLCCLNAPSEGGSHHGWAPAVTPSDPYRSAGVLHAPRDPTSAEC